MGQDDQKLAAARGALEFVESGMKLGLGSGSTAEHFVRLLGAEAKTRKLDLVCIATSQATQRLAAEVGLRIATLDEHPQLDLTIDGADEIDPRVRLIKGGGGALTREKIVAVAAKRMIVIADASKKVKQLGKFPLPIEVLQFGLERTRLEIADIGSVFELEGPLTLRRGGDGQPFVTDNGNFIIDAAWQRLTEVEALSGGLKLITGVVEHGLFEDLAQLAIIAGPQGLERIEAPEDFGLDDLDSDDSDLGSAEFTAIMDEMMGANSPFKKKKR